MAEDELPKDYSSVYCEDIKPPPVPPMRRTGSHHSSYHKPDTIWSDGAKSHHRQIESTADLRAVVAKLRNIPHPSAMDSLNEHYSSVFNDRRKISFKAYIQYFEDKETYVVRVDQNTLGAIKERMPRRGNYRYFFKQLDNTCEEVESDQLTVPFHERGGSKQIYCQVFPY